MRDANQELYPGYKKYSQLSSIVYPSYIKCLDSWSSKSFSMLLELLKDAFPEAQKLPNPAYETKKITAELGLGYEKIHDCCNDRMLLWKEDTNLQACSICSTSRWQTNKTIRMMK